MPLEALICNAAEGGVLLRDSLVGGFAAGALRWDAEGAPSTDLPPETLMPWRTGAVAAAALTGCLLAAALDVSAALAA
jgi:hypothetical protein